MNFAIYHGLWVGASYIFVFVWTQEKFGHKKERKGIFQDPPPWHFLSFPVVVVASFASNDMHGL